MRLRQDTGRWLFRIAVFWRRTIAGTVRVLVQWEIGFPCVYDVVCGCDARRVVKVTVGVLMFGLEGWVRVAAHTRSGLVRRLLGIGMGVGHDDWILGVVEDVRR